MTPRTDAQQHDGDAEKKANISLPLSPTTPRRPSLASSIEEEGKVPHNNEINKKKHDSWTEVRLFLELAIPIILFGAGFMLFPVLTSSIVGRKFGATYLSAFTLANLTGNLCTFSILTGLYSASDTLSPQAFGMKNYREVGLIGIRGFVASAALLVPINIVLVSYLKEILIALGQDEEASELAQQWYRIFVCGLPSCILYYTIEKFLSAQHIMRPLVVVTLIDFGLIPVALIWFTDTFGFLGSAMAYVFFQTSAVTMLLLYLKVYQPHVAETWPGLSAWREALQREKMIEYLHLGTGGILGQSEWVYWEALSLIVGRLGVIPLTAHAIPNNLIMAVCQIPWSAAVALTIRIGTVISDSVARAKTVAFVTLIGITFVFGFLVSVIMYFQADRVISCFTYDPDVIELARKVWWKVCAYNCNVTFYCVFYGIATGLGMQWMFGAVTFFFMWIVGVPVTVYYALIQGGGLDATWTWINLPYVAINVILLVVFATTDWDAIRDKIIEENEQSPSVELEKTNLATTFTQQDERTRLLDETKPSTGYGMQGV